VRLAVGEAAADGRADTGREHRVDRIEVEADMQERRPGEEGERVAQDALDAEPVDLAHRVDAHVELLDQLALARVERADADERCPRHRRRRVETRLEDVAAHAERGGERHAVHVSCRGGARPVQVAVRVDPEGSAGTARLRHPTECPHRDRVVAAEHERQELLADRLLDERRDPLARLLDRPEVAGVDAALVDRFRHGRADVAPVVDRTPERADADVELGVADRRGPHVDAAATLSEVERRTDHRDRRLPPLGRSFLHVHAEKGSSALWRPLRSRCSWLTTTSCSSNR